MHRWLSLALVLGVVGCAQAAPAKDYANKAFAFSYPGAYEVERESPFGDVIFEQEVGKRKSRLYVRTIEGQEVEDRYAKTKAEYQGGKVKLLQDAPQTVGGAPGHRLAIADDGKQNVYELTVVARHEDRGVHIKFTYPDAKPPAHLLGEVDQMLDSFSWKKGDQASSK